MGIMLPPFHVVSGGRAKQASFPLHAIVQPGAGHRLQNAHHGRSDTAPLDEVDLLPKDRRRVVVEAHDEAALNLQPRALNPLHILDHVPLEVLLLAALGQAAVIRRLDADEDRVEPRVAHQLQQLGVVCQVDRDLGVERHPGLAAAPRDQRRQEILLQDPFVPDEVIIHKEDALAPAQIVQPIQLTPAPAQSS